MVGRDVPAAAVVAETIPAGGFPVFLHTIQTIDFYPRYLFEDDGSAVAVGKREKKCRPWVREYTPPRRKYQCTWPPICMSYGRRASVVVLPSRRD